MSLTRHHQLSEPRPVNDRRSQSLILSKDQADLRALLLEGADSPKTTILDHDYIEKLRRASHARMAL